METHSEETHLKTMLLLQAVFNFDDNDLIANRYGQISDNQKHRLPYYVRIPDIVWAILLILFSWLFFLQIFLSANIITLSEGEITIRRDTEADIVFISMILFYTVVLYSFITYKLYIRSRRKIRKSSDVVYRVSGVAILSTSTPNLYRHHYYHKPTYKLSINGQKFYIANEAFHALENGEIYSVYYIKKPKKIIAIEPVKSKNFTTIYQPTAKY